MGGRVKREGTYAYLRLIHVDVWQKPTPYCKAIILQLKINLKNLRESSLKKKKKKSAPTWRAGCRQEQSLNPCLNPVYLASDV